MLPNLDPERARPRPVEPLKLQGTAFLLTLVTLGLAGLVVWLAVTSPSI